MENQNSNFSIQTPSTPAAPSVEQQPVQPAPMAQMPAVPMPAKKKNLWFWITVGTLVAVGGLAWWYVSQMAVEAPVVQQPKIDKQAREDMLLQSEVQATNEGNLDKEFTDIDKDLNSL